LLPVSVAWRLLLLLLLLLLQLPPKGVECSVAT
jgi:hypothetical protein